MELVSENSQHVSRGSVT